MDITTPSKICIVCKTARPLTAYARNHLRGGGLAATCNDCCAAARIRSPRRPRRRPQQAMHATTLNGAVVSLLTILYGHPRGVAETLVAVLLRGAR